MHKPMGYPRHQFYGIRRNDQTYGSAGLLDKVSGCRGPHPNRIAQEVEDSFLTSPQPAYQSTGSPPSLEAATHPLFAMLSETPATPSGTAPEWHN